jgi:hypothetical protein
MMPEETPRGALYELLVFCEEERERCRNSGESFDEDLFNEAVNLAKRKVRTILGEQFS